VNKSLVIGPNNLLMRNLHDIQKGVKPCKGLI